MLLLPTICLLCHQYHRGKYAICMSCESELPLLGPTCPTCARPCADLVDTPNNIASCGKCLTSMPYLDHVIAAYRFEEPLRSLMHTFKYREGFYLSGFIAHLMSNTNKLALLKNTECLIPIPMHRSRLKQRGFNQAAVLARALSQSSNIPYKINACKKIRNTIPQAELKAKERAHNLKDAFQANRIKYSNVTLVDDLLTTGHTANELAKTLKEQGVSTVNLWCCARTVCL